MQELSRIEIGKNFEAEAYEFLKERFDKVIWLSKKSWKSPIDFECYKGKRKIMIEAKLNPISCISRANKDIDFFITIKKGNIILISKNQSPQSNFIPKKISIPNKQSLWIDKNTINLSRFVQGKLEEVMTK